MHWLAETDRTAAQWVLGVSLILVIGAAAILLIVLIAVGRRWARRQHQSIDRDRQVRRAAQSGERVDAWSAGSQRYVDRDKLPDDATDDNDTPDDPNAPGGWDADDPPGEGEPTGYNPGRDDEPMFHDEQDDRDPYGLFKDKPYQEPDDDEDDFGEDFDSYDNDFDDDDESGDDEDDTDDRDADTDPDDPRR